MAGWTTADFTVQKADVRLGKTEGLMETLKIAIVYIDKGRSLVEVPSGILFKMPCAAASTTRYIFEAMEKNQIL